VAVPALPSETKTMCIWAFCKEHAAAVDSCAVEGQVRPRPVSIDFAKDFASPYRTLIVIGRWMRSENCRAREDEPRQGWGQQPNLENGTRGNEREEGAAPS